MFILGNITTLILILLIYIIIRAELQSAKNRKERLKKDIAKRLIDLNNRISHTKCAYCPTKASCSEYQLLIKSPEYKSFKERL